MSQVRPGFALVALFAVLAGCGKAPVGSSPVPTAAGSQTAVAMAVSTAGKVEIRVQGLGGGYHVAATTTQVAKLRVTLSGGPLTTPVVQTVSAAALSSGAGTIVFADLPAGTVTVTIEALDASDAVVGTQSASAPVSNGATAVVAVALKLNATHQTASVGSIAVDVQVSDGDVVVDPVASASPHSPVLSPAPSPTPTPSPTPEVGTVGFVNEADRSWLGDGRMAVSGLVKNTWSTPKKARVKAIFFKKGLLGFTEVETLTHDFGAIDAKSQTYFHLESSKKVSSLLGEGTATLTLEQY